MTNATYYSGLSQHFQRGFCILFSKVKPCIYLLHMPYLKCSYIQVIHLLTEDMHLKPLDMTYSVFLEGF